MTDKVKKQNFVIFTRVAHIVFTRNVVNSQNSKKDDDVSEKSNRRFLRVFYKVSIQ